APFQINVRACRTLSSSVLASPFGREQAHQITTPIRNFSQKPLWIFSKIIGSGAHVIGNKFFIKL
ncbi:MAG: hypothetical protein WCI36_03900, partial [bacterium]